MILLALAILNPDVSQATIDTTICKSGWSTSVRPARGWAYRQKVILIRAKPHHYSPAGYVADHKMPIELGGAPHDRANIQLQTKAAGRRKDLVENHLHRAVCSGKLTLDAAQTQMGGYRP